MDKIQLAFCTSIQEVNASDWNRLCDTDYPFICYEFLAALESSQSTTSDTGWLPYHLLAFREIEGQPRLVAAMPLFIKGHSYGEYVFDWAWADAYERHGLSYYPKLLNAIPFTPSQGPRFIGDHALMPLFFQRCLEEVERLNLSSAHWLFMEQSAIHQILSKEDRPSHSSHERPLAQNTFSTIKPTIVRRGCQFHWFNKGYHSFDDFLSGCSARKRKTLKKERQKIHDQGITLSRVLGEDLTLQDWSDFFGFYKNTYLKRSGHEGYLSADFFEKIGHLIPHNIMMVKAEHDGNCVASALYFYSKTHLYGRYWGCNQEFDQLHFETCYYQGIEFAIEKRLTCFDAGAQGEHKISRGFEPKPTFSLHWLAHPEFHHAIKQFAEKEAKQVEAYEQAARAKLPFKSQTG